MRRGWHCLYVFILTIVVGGSTLAQTPAETQATLTGLADGEAVLAWLADGTRPGEWRGTPGQLVSVTGSGQLTPVLALPERATRVQPCGEAPLSPAGDLYLFYAGGDTGALYAITPQGRNEILSENLHALACAGGKTIQYNPDGSQLGFLEYPVNYNQVPSPLARLVVINRSGLVRDGVYNDVAAFHLGARLATVTYELDSNQRATNATITQWSQGEGRRLATVRPPEGCYYVAMDVTLLGAMDYAIVAGYRCARGDGRSRWELYTIAGSGQGATQIITDSAGGGYFPASRTAFVAGSVDASTLFVSVPDGLRNYTASFDAVTISDGARRNGIATYIEMGRLNYNPVLIAQRTPVVAADMPYIALVRNDANNNNALVVLDLLQPGLPPIQVPLPNRGDIVTALFFIPGQPQLVYVAGDARNGNSAIYSLDLVTGLERRLYRGRYELGILNPDGTVLAVSNWQTVISQQPPIYHLALIDLATGAAFDLFRGGEVVDGRVTNQRSLVPLAWWRTR